MVLISLRICASWSEPLLPVHALEIHFRKARLIRSRLKTYYSKQSVLRYNWFDITLLYTSYNRSSMTFNGNGHTLKGSNSVKVVFVSLPKRSLLYKERICSQEEQILSCQSRPLFRRWLVCREAHLMSQKFSPLWKWWQLCQVYSVSF